MVLVDGTEVGKKGAAGAEEGSGMPKACRYCRHEQIIYIYVYIIIWLDWLRCDYWILSTHLHGDEFLFIDEREVAEMKPIPWLEKEIRHHGGE